MAYCFVIQPFDGGRFDKRYTDVFKPAIEAAGLEPYRVDRDPSVSIPINEIENGIRAASVCFADVTLDNPNVWFELGYALASDKEICLICSEERVSKFPFDVQHRSIIKYNVDSSSDYHSLRDRITARLEAINKKAQSLAVVSTKSPLKEDPGMSQHEMIVLAAIMENRDGPGAPVTHWAVRNDLDKLGYNNMALNIGLEKLISKQMIKPDTDHDQDGNVYNVYYVHAAGLQWMMNNSERLELRSRVPAKNSGRRSDSSLNDSDDEIPF